MNREPRVRKPQDGRDYRVHARRVLPVQTPTVSIGFDGNQRLFLFNAQTRDSLASVRLDLGRRQRG